MKVICIQDGKDMWFAAVDVHIGNEYNVVGECHKNDPQKHHYHLAEFPPLMVFDPKLFAPCSEIDETTFERESITEKINA